MNLFLLARCPKRAARLQCKKHVPKMLLEACQQLYCMLHLRGVPLEPFAGPDGTPVKPYGKTHSGHPCVQWICARTANAVWALEHAFELVEVLREWQAARGLSEPIKCEAHLLHLSPIVRALPTQPRLPGPQLRDLPLGCGSCALAINIEEYILDAAPPAEHDRVRAYFAAAGPSAVERYRRYYALKATYLVPMCWDFLLSGERGPPLELRAAFAALDWRAPLPVPEPKPPKAPKALKKSAQPKAPAARGTKRAREAPEVPAAAALRPRNE